MNPTGLSDSNFRIIAALPAFNEERYLGSVILKTAKYADEVIVVDDGSNDGTAEIARLAGAKVIRHETNNGKGSALTDVLHSVKSQPPDALVFIDADGQHNPDEIPRLVDAVRQGFDLVIGSRKDKKKKAPLYRRFGQGILSVGTGVAAGGGRPVIDSESGFRALSSRFIREIELTEKGFAVETEMIVKATAKGLKITEVPISTIYVEDGSTQNPVRHGLGVLGSIINMISERRPLLFFGVGGAILCLLGILAGVRVLAAFSQFHEFAIGTAILCAVFTIVGVFSIFTGIVLNILTRNQGHKR
jgi:glycosyltransferase involved in cell wall biosynthesis